MIYAIDTETIRFSEAQSITHRSRPIRIGPPPIPELKFVSICSENMEVELHAAQEGVARLRELLDAKEAPTFVFHNVAFDYAVLRNAGLDLLGMRVSVQDTMLLDMLYRLSQGAFDRPKYPSFTVEDFQARSLAVLACEYAGMNLEKDEAIRINFGGYNRVDQLPPSFQSYAKLDAVATMSVYRALMSRTDGRDLSGSLQATAAMALTRLDAHGIRIDQAEARRLLRLFEKDMPWREASMVNHGFGAWKNVPHTIRTEKEYPEGLGWIGTEWNRFEDRIWRRTARGRIESAEPIFQLNTRALRDALVPIARRLHLEVPRTEKTDELTLTADFWAEHIPCDHPLQTWLERQKLEKILSTYLRLYVNTPRVYCRWRILGARSGRMSSSGPNVMNVPKRKYGIRSLFVPDPGDVFIKADYSTQELFTLAEEMSRARIEGPLLRAIKDGRDLHRFTAALVSRVPYDEVTAAQRQAAKAINFGIPGGLGPRKFADYAKKEYGIEWTLEEAKGVRTAYLDAFWDVRRFLNMHRHSLDLRLQTLTGRGIVYWKGEVGLPEDAPLPEFKHAMLQSKNPALKKVFLEAERCLFIRLSSGRIRGSCSFTEGCNTYFQGLASDVTKAALIKAVMSGLNVVLVVHDELVVQVSANANIPVVQGLLKFCMLEAFRDVCPTVGQYARVDVSDPITRWGPATSGGGLILCEEVECAP